MSRILIVYGTTEGQTRKIAGRIAEMARGYGHEAVVVDSAGHPPPVGTRYDAVIVAGSLHQQKHQRTLAAFVRENRDALRRIPTAFVSVSLTAVRTDPASVAAAQACVDAFVRQTGWMPRETWLTAGALAYTRYGPIEKLLMRRIARRNGGATDTTRDHEYTDWVRLRGQVRAFLQPLHAEELAEELEAVHAGV